MSLIHREKGNHPAFSEDWLLDNLPPGWTYDCQTTEPQGFVIHPPVGAPLFIPLALLKRNRNNKEFRKVSIEEAMEHNRDRRYRPAQ